MFTGCKSQLYPSAIRLLFAKDHIFLQTHSEIGNNFEKSRLLIGEHLIDFDHWHS